MKKLLRVIIGVLLVALIFLLGYGLGEEQGRHDSYRGNPDSNNGAISQQNSGSSFLNLWTRNDDDLNLSTFWSVWSIVQDEFLYKTDIDTDKLQYGATYGLVQALGDPYTVFFEPDTSEEFIESIEGSFEGIGAALYVNEGLITIEYTLKESPAMSVGLKAGDIIYKINEDTTTDMTLSEAVQKIRGEKGTNVELTILREDSIEPIVVSVTRETILVPSVTWNMVEETNIAYIAINQFIDNTPQDFEKAANELLLENPTGIIIDLRYNPGGYFDGAVDILGNFISDGVVVKRELNSTIKDYNVHGNARLAHLPVVVLINGSSASAAEIVAGALRDYEVAELVGETTFGKGTIQDFIQLENGASLKLTTAKWLTPNGTWVNEHPLEPDYAVELTEEDLQNERDPQMDKAIELLQQ